MLWTSWTLLLTSPFLPVHDSLGLFAAMGDFDVDDRLWRLSDLGDQLEAHGRVVDFEAFRPDLEKALAYTSGAHGGRPPYDPVLMLKVLVIQTANNRSDERTEFLINDRLSFMRFKHGFVSRVHRKKPKGRPMPEATRSANDRKSKVRSRVEHVFAEQKGRMDLFIRTIGIARTTTKIGLANFVYNMKRLIYLDRIAAA